mgnify:CR=1 FL=1
MADRTHGRLDMRRQTRDASTQFSYAPVTRKDPESHCPRPIDIVANRQTSGNRTRRPRKFLGTDYGAPNQTAETAPAASAGRTPSGLTSGLLTVRTRPLVRNRAMFAPDDFAKPVQQMLNEKVLEAAEIEVRDIVPWPRRQATNSLRIGKARSDPLCITMTAQWVPAVTYAFPTRNRSWKRIICRIE